MFTVKNKNEFGELREIELTDFEEVNNISLPEDYKKFLRETNGGEPVLNRNESPDNIVTYIFGFHNGEYFASLYAHITMFQNRLAFSTFPIASDPFGNLFIMTLHPENYGQIFFWDHEGEPEHQDGHYTANCSFVAYSFSEFINNLK